MVSLNTLSPAFMLSDVYICLCESLKSIEPNSIDGAFTQWLYPDSKHTFHAQLPSDFSVTNYTHVSQLGFLSNVLPEYFGGYQSQLIDGLNRVSGRPITLMGTGPAPFCDDAIALLGLGLGAKLIGGNVLHTITKWMLSFINFRATNLPEWKKILMFVTLFLLGEDTINNPLRDLTQNTDDLKVAFTSRGITCFADYNLDSAYHATCNGTLHGEVETYQVAARLQALEYLSNHLPIISFSRPTIQQVVTLLENIPHAFRRWVWEDKAKTIKSTAQKWDIQNEYHVQSLIYFVLAPLFPDIETEFYLEPIGQQNPRADIGIPSLNLIIEIKFLRSSGTFQHMTEEVAADSALYFKKADVFRDKYSKMIVFLWDNSARTQEHETFKRGVKGLGSIADAIVITRPGNMLNPTTALKIKEKTKAIKR